jgi:AraC-like DNA-binding protein
VSTRQTIRRVPFVSPLSAGMQVMSFAQLWAAAPPGVLARPVRPDFHSLLFTTDGDMRHTVDFDEYNLAPGSVLWVRPGQVQHFSDDRPTGDLVLFQADFLLPGTRAARIADDRHGPVSVAGAGAALASVERKRRVLRREYTTIARRSQPTAAQTETLQHLLSVLVLSLEAPDRPREEAPGLDARFRDLLDQAFTIAHGVDYYARRLGYSQRTLNRATQAAAGESPKQAINRRIALEARRLLAHTDQPVTAIARTLGFNDASNFAAFFAHRTGETPTGFRRRIRTDQPQDAPPTDRG